MGSILRALASPKLHFVSSGVHFGSFGGSLSAILEALGSHWATIGGPARPRLIFSKFWLPFGVHFGSILAQETVNKYNHFFDQVFD